jgi:hypothetical protein
MIGSFRWNLFAGAIGLIGTFLMSISQNVLNTALIKSVYSFIFLFIFTFVIRWILGILVSASGVNPGRDVPKEEFAESHKGRSIDYSTPEDDPINSKDHATEDDQLGFSPLNPPKLTTKLDQDPEEIVKALRRMTEE